MRLRATEAILVETVRPRAEDYPSWMTVACTWLALFGLGFGLAYLLLWYRQRKHEKAVKRHQKILDKQRLKRASLNALMAANDSAEALARKTGVGDTGQNYDGDYHHEKGPKEAGARRHDHHRRKVKERTRPRVSATPLPSPARDRSPSPAAGNIRKSKLVPRG